MHGVSTAHPYSSAMRAFKSFRLAPPGLAQRSCEPIQITHVASKYTPSMHGSFKCASEVSKDRDFSGLCILPSTTSNR